jgi:hypothetical protein
LPLPEAISMARYIPQYIFDGLAVRLLMTELAETPEIFDDLLQKYFQKYPDENPAALAADLHAAANEGRWVIKVTVDAPDSSYHSEMAVLEALLDVLTKAATLEKPMWRRMVENYFFSVQPTPIPDRVARAKEHLVAAEKVLTARMTPVA